MKYSVVTTLYRSALYIEEFLERMKRTLQLYGDAWEIIVVNDGSPDDSLEIARKVAAEEGRITVINLSRNFGHHIALMTGLQHTSGEMVFLIDSDLEEEPELFTTFHEILTKDDSLDVIVGVQEHRKGNVIERVGGEIFYWIMDRLTSVKITRNAVTARLMKRNYVNALVKFQERECNLVGIYNLAGFTQKQVHIKKHSHSPTTYTFRKKLGVIINTLTAYSHRPLVGIFYVGLCMSMGSFIIISTILIQKLLSNSVLSGWTSMMLSIWFLGSVQILCIGVLALYVSKIFVEVKQRPYSIIKDIYQKDAS